ncbi:MAG TPA: 50S ribosomal protein L30 [Rhodothermales bacterium]|nr:50S ribosomal protein L30 [Rhodothermales bacterium]
MPKLRITQTRSLIRQPDTHKRTIKALGLGRINRTVVRDDTPEIRGMLTHVHHLVKAEEVNP